MKKVFLLMKIMLIFKVSVSYAQYPAPMFLLGNGLDGSTYQIAGIYADTSNGFALEAPLDGTGAKLPITLTWRGNGPVGLKILPNGNTGIGTATPRTMLDVAGQINSSFVGIGQPDVASSPRNFVNFGANQHGTLLLASNLYTSGDDQLNVANSHVSMAGAGIMMPGNMMPLQGSIVFFTRPAGTVTANSSYTNTASMLIGATGNVGIGTTNPGSYKLAVEGTIGARKVKVTSVAGWADHVFEPGYALPSLHEIETYIKTHKHLPGIPSEQEVKAEGFDLAEMNKLLLQKVEELTLHLIEMKKDNDQLRAEVQEMKKAQ
jgi:hypothetical protein